LALMDYEGFCGTSLNVQDQAMVGLGAGVFRTPVELARMRGPAARSGRLLGWQIPWTFRYWAISVREGILAHGLRGRPVISLPGSRSGRTGQKVLLRPVGADRRGRFASTRPHLGQRQRAMGRGKGLPLRRSSLDARNAARQQPAPTLVLHGFAESARLSEGCEGVLGGPQLGAVVRLPLLDHGLRNLTPGASAPLAISIAERYAVSLLQTFFSRRATEGPSVAAMETGVVARTKSCY